jgi:hypothetical protein
MDKKFAITLSSGELKFLCNSINETLEAVEDWEFQTRTGSTAKEGEQLLVRLKNVLLGGNRLRTASNNRRQMPGVKPGK